MIKMLTRQTRPGGSSASVLDLHVTMDPPGPANPVAIRTHDGLVGCGAFDVAPLDSFSYPAEQGGRTCRGISPNRNFNRNF